MWSVYTIMARSSKRITKLFEDKRADLERNKGKPGFNSVRANKAIHEKYNWSRGGHEWSLSPEWFAAVVEEFIRPHLFEGATVLEIGPGAGRWTEVLYEHSSELYLVDITPVTLDLCRKRFGTREGIAYFLSDGVSLTGVPDQGVNFVWSFDVFVHIAPADQRRYLAEIKRVMMPGAHAVIHHGGRGSGQGFRSAMTDDLFRSMVAEAGLHLVRQAQAWGPNESYGLPEHGDVVTVFEA